MQLDKSRVGKTCLAVGFMIGIFMAAPGPGLCEKTGASQKEMVLTMATYVPVGYPVIDEAQRFFVDRVNEIGTGSVKIDMYWGGVLLGARDILPGLQAGTAHIVFQTSAYLLGSFPVLGIHTLPIWPDIVRAHHSLKMGTPLADLQNDILREKDLYQLAVGGVVPEFLFTRDKVVRSPGDMRGLKIRVSGRSQGVVIQALGAVPITLPSADLPQAMQRRVIDGALMNAWSARGRGLEDLCKYMHVFPFSNQSIPIYVKLSTWEKWPDQVQKILIDAAHDWEGNMAELFDVKYNLERDIVPSYEAVGIKAVRYTEEEERAFYDALKPVNEWWIKEVGDDVGRKALEMAGSVK